MSRRKLILAVSGMAFVLLLVLAFILLGIIAMTTGTSFGAVINSLLPLGAGGALGGTAAAQSASEAEEEAEREGGGKFGATVEAALESMAPTE